jgi:hypothetical protein
MWFNTAPFFLVTVFPAPFFLALSFLKYLFRSAQARRIPLTGSPRRGGKFSKLFASLNRETEMSILSTSHDLPGRAYGFPKYSSATLSAIAGAATSARLASTITVNRSSGNRSMAVRNPTVSP